VEEYDFLGGVGRHKTDWGATIKTSKRIVLGGRQGQDVLFWRGREWAFQARQALKQYLPDRLLRAFDARQERRRIASFEQSATASPMGDVARCALAGGYFYSPLPALLSPLRDRYHLSVSPSGKLPGIKLQKRGQPSVRILYFHCVNDEGDPFFPAMPTAVFERQMRFLARHYRVVSLSEAARRLSEGGPPVPVVALTFDDGYQDNYQNAFPILERYGLPATIFLTTGAIDGRELLWFEKVALALKLTSQKHIDLEIDIPRRFRLGTEAERLRAQGQIHAILRNLPDTERCRWVGEILTLLGGCDPRSEKMLTWDQIRFMNQRRIDFGGHTVTHPFVSRLLPTQATWEASECKKRIETELQTPVEHFAYPHGREVDFAAWNKQVLQEAGYRTAVSTLWGINYPTTDRMELRRGGPWEHRPALFGAKLDWYQWTDI
jgi:peptidoglycan/xylan/chitin deacetylase (PgdA/CDA1 family)